MQWAEPSTGNSTSCYELPQARSLGFHRDPALYVLLRSDALRIIARSFLRLYLD